MAQFPTSPKSFTARSNGQTIDASHVQDLQDEVNAIEDGYLNGTARLNSSRSTLASLSVTGNSTVAALTAGASTAASLVVSGGSTLTTLQVTGNSTFDGNVTINGTLTATLGSRNPVCKVTHGSTQTVANGTWVGLSWNTEITDSTGMHSTAANSSRINLTSSGLWMVGGCADFSIGTNPSTLNLGVRVLLNDTDRLVASLTAPGGGLQTDPHALMCAVPYVAATTTDYITLQVYQSGGVGQSVHGSSNLTLFWAYKVSA